MKRIRCWIGIGLFFGMVFSGCGKGPESTVENLPIAIRYESTVSDMKEEDIAAGAIVKTLGFYEEEDKGGATYQIVDDPQLEEDGAFVHLLNNGMKAKMVIENETVNVRQLGAVADQGELMGNTDNFEAFTAAFESEVPTIDLVGGAYYIGEGKRLKINREIQIDGKGATIIADSGVLFDVSIKRHATVSNLYVSSGSEGMPRKGIGIEVVNDAEEPKWGGSVDFYNVNIFHYSVGFQGDLLYNNELNTIYSAYNDIGYRFISSGIFSNMNENYSLSAMHNTYGIVMENFRNATFNNTVLESNGYGVVIDEDSEFVDFRNTWFELIEMAPVAFGTISEDTMELIPSGATNDRVHFTDNRWSQVETESEIFYSADTLFTSRYRQVDGPNYDFEELMDSGIVYTNYAQDSFTVDSASGGEPATVTEMTPFGQKKVTKISSADEGGDLSISFPFQSFEEGHSYLVKYKVRLNQAGTIITAVPSSPTAVAGTSDKAWVEADAWTDVATILQMQESFDDPEKIVFDDDGKVSFTVEERSEGLDVEVMEPAVYDLTEIFGSGNEPDVRLNDELGKYFSYVDYLHTGKTGNFSGDYSDKERIGVSLQNGWTGEASYRYLGNGLTEIVGVNLGTGMIGSEGTELFKIPSEYAPANTSVQLAVSEGNDPTGMLQVRVASDGTISIAAMVGYSVPENDPDAAVQFNFIVSSDER
ncbi:hypothetical protein [Trichococcus ilyis]|nr:hypothetical protein [Trichococcus ilyis]